MAEAALKEEVREAAPVRRFELADLSKHGAWMLKRFTTKLPDVPEQQIAGYLRGILFDNEHCFLYQDHAVGLAQIVYTSGIRPVKVVQERFVWVENREDKAQLADAADFYEHFRMWGKRIGAERIFACEDTDVPKTLIEQHLGRLFDAKISHVRIV